MQPAGQPLTLPSKRALGELVQGLVQFAIGRQIAIAELGNRVLAPVIRMHRVTPEFSPNHAIDGLRGARGYWVRLDVPTCGCRVEFGREVQAERAVRRRASTVRIAQDRTWTGATLEFSSGEKVPVVLRNTSGPQEFTFPRQKCAWIKLVDFQERFPLADNGIAEFEVYGKDL